MIAAEDIRRQQGLVEVARRERAVQQRAARIAAGPSGMANQLAHQWLAPPHIEALNKQLARVATEPLRLVVSMPPRHGKSEMCSKWLPAWFLALFPDRQVLLASYEADFAMKWGRKVRDAISEHADKLGTSISDDSSSASRWNTAQGGGMETSGVGGAMTGKGAHLLIVDDPVKNAEEADSETIRERTWDWFTSTAYTRLEPGASIVLIMTRWHEDDLAGRVLELAKTTGEHWDVLELPAIAEEHDLLGRPRGAALWPERYDEDALASIERVVGPRVWEALYQQHPSSPQGTILLREWWEWYDAPRDRYDELLQSWDFTFKDTQGSDLVCGFAMGIRGAVIDLLDCFWKRANFVASCDAVEAMTKAHPLALAKLIEDKANGPAIISQLQGKISGIIAIEPKGGKRARAIAVTPILRAKQVRLPRGVAWASKLVEECAAFPTGKHDDGVDALTQGLNYLMHRAYVEPPKKPAIGSDEWEAEAEAAELRRPEASEDSDLW